MRAEDEPQVRHPQAGGPEPGGGGGSQPGDPGCLNKILSYSDQMSFWLATAQPLVAAIFICLHTKGEGRSGQALKHFRAFLRAGGQIRDFLEPILGKGKRGQLGV